jgi:hypothetical protein
MKVLAQIINLHLAYIQALCMAQWLERRYIDLMILTSQVKIPLWGMGVVPLDETI